MAHAYLQEVVISLIEIRFEPDVNNANVTLGLSWGVSLSLSGLKSIALLLGTVKYVWTRPG